MERKEIGELIHNNIYENDNGEITADILNKILSSINKKSKYPQDNIVVGKVMPFATAMPYMWYYTSQHEILFKDSDCQQYSNYHIFIDNVDQGKIENIAYYKFGYNNSNREIYSIPLTGSSKLAFKVNHIDTEKEEIYIETKHISNYEPTTTPGVFIIQGKIVNTRTVPQIGNDHDTVSQPSHIYNSIIDVKIKYLTRCGCGPGKYVVRKNEHIYKYTNGMPGRDFKKTVKICSVAKRRWISQNCLIKSFYCPKKHL